MSFENSRYRAVNIIGAVVLLVVGIVWAAYVYARDGSYIIENGYVIGVWVVDPMMKALPIALISGSLVIIVLALAWPKTRMDEHRTMIAPGGRRRALVLLPLMAGLFGGLYLIYDDIPGLPRNLLLAACISTFIVLGLALAWPYLDDGTETQGRRP